MVFWWSIGGFGRAVPCHALQKIGVLVSGVPGGFPHRQVPHARKRRDVCLG